MEVHAGSPQVEPASKIDHDWQMLADGHASAEQAPTDQVESQAASNSDGRGVPAEQRPPSPPHTPVPHMEPSSALSIPAGPSTVPPESQSKTEAPAEEAATQPLASTTRQTPEPEEEAGSMAQPSAATPKDPDPAAWAPSSQTPATETPATQSEHPPSPHTAQAEAPAAASTSQGPASLPNSEAPSEVAPANNMSVHKAKSLFEQASPSKAEPAALPKPQLRSSASPTQTPVVKAPDPAPKANGPSSKAAATAAKAVPASPHDLKNTVNASQLLKSGAFSRVPGKDLIPYDELILLRLEDSIDVTRKEDYLSSAEFEKVFEMTRDAYNKLPGWKRAQAKKRVHLF